MTFASIRLGGEARDANVGQGLGGAENSSITAAFAGRFVLEVMGRRFGGGQWRTGWQCSKRETGGWQLIPMRQDCPDCQRLWREYAAATTTHVGLENHLRQLLQGSASEALIAEVAAAAAVREAARQAIPKHEMAAHEGMADAADTDS